MPRTEPMSVTSPYAISMRSSTPSSRNRHIVSLPRRGVSPTTRYSFASRSRARYAPSWPVIPVMSAVLFNVDSLAPVVESVRQRGGERRRGRPAGVAPDLADVGSRATLLVGTHPRRILANLRVDAGNIDQPRQHVGHRRLAARADVVGLSALGGFEQCEIGANDVAYVGQVARDVQVAGG